MHGQVRHRSAASGLKRPRFEACSVNDNPQRQSSGYPKFAPGFRLSRFDIAILSLGSTAAVVLAFVNLWVGSVVLFVVLHFFLFCNVVRMSRVLELVWAAVFIAGSAWAIYSGSHRYIPFVVSAVLTPCLAIIEMRKPSYHGVGWRTVNPKLQEWWDREHADRGMTAD